MWSRLIGKVQSETFETSSIGDLKVKSRLAGLEVGLDLDRHTNEAGSTSIYGLYGGNAWSHATVNPNATGANDNQGWLAGLYATHYSVDGWYADAAVQGSWLDMTAEGGQRQRCLNRCQRLAGVA